MLSRLLESKARRNRSLFGMTVSIAAHVAVVVAAVHATAQSRPHSLQPAKVSIVPFVPQRPHTNPRDQEKRKPDSKLAVPKPVNPINFYPRIPPIDFMPPSLTSAADFRSGGISINNGPQVSDSIPAGAFRADQVERQVTVLPGAPAPRYPESLRAAGIEGSVLAQFTVNELGLVERDSVRFVRSDNVLFEESVRSALARMRFSPAEVAGRKVRQLVQMPFVFTLSGR